MNSFFETTILIFLLLATQSDSFGFFFNQKPVTENLTEVEENPDNLISDSEKTTYALTNQSLLETNETSGVENTSTLLESMSTNFTKVNCSLSETYGPVEIVNATRLVELLVSAAGAQNGTRSSKEDKLLPATCLIIMFYARWCIFSSQAAPHFNAIPRFYPNLKVVAIDAMKYQNFNTQYGIVGVPTLMLVHNAKPVAKFNGTIYTLENFSRFISQMSNLQPNESLYVKSSDFVGPVSSVPTNETDYCLVMSWVFITACILYFTTKSQWWRQFIESVQNTWKESNAQHEHAE